MENVHTYPKFTPEMKATHKILIPNMAPIHFEMMRAAMEDEGYHVEVLGSGGHAVAQEGLKYVHNDTCYPALLVIGQFINALKSGKYDLDHTALLITQTGGGGRASNYIAGESGLSSGARCHPEFFRSGKGQRLSVDASAHPKDCCGGVLRRRADEPCQPDAPL